MGGDLGSQGTHTGCVSVWISLPWKGAAEDAKAVVDKRLESKVWKRQGLELSLRASNSRLWAFSPAFDFKAGISLIREVHRIQALVELISSRDGSAFLGGQQL